MAFLTPVSKMKTKPNFEEQVLDSSDESSWEHHIFGASNLLQMRGPKKLLSQYEMDLSISLIGPIVCTQYLSDTKIYTDLYFYLRYAKLLERMRLASSNRGPGRMH